MMSSILRVSCFPGSFLTFFLLLFVFPGFYFSVIFSWISFYRMFLAGGWKITCCFSSLGTPADSAGNGNRAMMIMMMMMMMIKKMIMKMMMVMVMSMRMMMISMMSITLAIMITMMISLGRRQIAPETATEP